MKALFNVVLMFFCAVIFFACQDGIKKQASGVANSGVEEEDAVMLNPTKHYATYCKACHGTDGQAGVSGAKNLATSKILKPSVIEMITEGSQDGKMMGYGNLLEKEEIEALADYVIGLRK